MLFLIQKGFSNPKEVEYFAKGFEILDTQIASIRENLQKLNISKNFDQGQKEIQALSDALEKLSIQQEEFQKKAKASVKAQAEGLYVTNVATGTKYGLDDKELNTIEKEIKLNGELEKTLKKLGETRENNYRRFLGQKFQTTGKAQNYINTANVSNLKQSDFNITDEKLAKSFLNKDMEVNIKKINEQYSATLLTIVKNGESAKAGIERLTEVLKNYGIELKNTAQVQQTFASDLKKVNDLIYEDASRVDKGNITKAKNKAQVLVEPDEMGNYNLNAEAQQLVNNVDLQNYLGLLAQIVQTQTELTNKILETTEANQNNRNAVNQMLNDSAKAQDKVRQTTDESIGKLYEESVAASEVDKTFSVLEDTLKSFFSLYNIVAKVRQVITQTFTDIQNLDKAFANIAMVTDFSVQDMWESYDSYAEMAARLGQTTQGVIEASGLYYQQGLDTTESLELTESTMKLATLAGLDFEDATQKMTAALRGFHMEMDEGERVTDVYSELAAKAAAEVEGIAYAMSKTASIGA